MDNTKNRENEIATKETFYFSHDYNARNDIKIKRLIVKHGYIGYGLYWALIEDLYQNANAMTLDYDCMAYEFRISKETIESIINDFDLFVVDGNKFGSLSVQRRLDLRIEKSNKARRSAMKRWERKTKQIQEKCERNTKLKKGNAIKESKVKESKVNSIVDTNVSMLDATQPTHQKIDYRAIIQFFNDETQGAFGNVMYPISEKRKQSIRARVNEFGKDEFAAMIRKASKSNFLKGDNNKGFVAKFDWMIRPSNFQKIIEGNYDNRNKGYSRSNEASEEELMHHIKQGIERGIKENAIE